MSPPFKPGDVVECVEHEGTKLVRIGKFYRIYGWRNGFVTLVGVLDCTGTVLAGFHPERFERADDMKDKPFDFRSMMGAKA